MHTHACTYTHTHTSTHTWTHTQTHTHLYLYVLVLVLVFTTARTDYVAPIQGVSQQEVRNKTGGPVGSGDASLISTSAWPPQCIGVLIYGLARPMR